MGTPVLWVLGVAGVLYFGAVLYAIYRGRDVKASLKIPFAMFSFETREPASSNRVKEQRTVGRDQRNVTPLVGNRATTGTQESD